MHARDTYLHAVPCWIDLDPPDVASTARFYGGVFGWEFEEVPVAGTSGPYLVARLRGGDVAGIGRPSSQLPPAPDWTTSIAVDDVPATAAAVEAAGGSVLAGPVEVPGHARLAACADPAGTPFRLWEAAGRVGAQRVNEPGTWNWSDLATDDPDGAARFYGAVFGWEVDEVSFGDEVTRMWRRPGYGDHLARYDPGIRARHAEAGAPAGFADAIGWLVPADGAAASWQVTIAVEDADQVAARTQAFGGRVEVPPFAAGPARLTVLRDPSGAVFTASAFTPPSG